MRWFVVVDLWWWIGRRRIYCNNLSHGISCCYEKGTRCHRAAGGRGDGSTIAGRWVSCLDAPAGAPLSVQANNPRVACDSYKAIVGCKRDWVAGAVTHPC